MSVGTHVTFDEYERMIAQGAFEPPEQHRVELIRGEVIPMSPKGPPHESILRFLNRWSLQNADLNRIEVGVTSSIGIPALASEPEPDIVWIRLGDYSSQHPRPDDVLLIIEVAESSLKKDTTTKAELYAEAGIADYWVVDVVGQVIEVFRDPDLERKRYRTKSTFTGDERLSPLCQPEAELRPGTLWSP